MHTDQVASSGSEAIVASAVARGVPVVSGKQMLDWVDGRNNSTFRNLSWSGNTFSFSINQATGATGLQTMLPLQGHGGTLSSISRGGTPVSYTTETIKGIGYAFPRGHGLVRRRLRPLGSRQTRPSLGFSG